MKKNNHCKVRLQKGFTLVELAIVLIIIGLLIGGTLKGQELINGARATATVSQIRALEAGALTFIDTYRAFPGDMLNAGVKLPDCTGDCIPNPALDDTARTRQDGGVDGQIGGNGVLDSAPGNTMAPGLETLAFFIHMFKADLMDGIDGSSGAPVVGRNVLPAKIGSGAYFRVGYIMRPNEMPNTGLGGGLATNGRTGHYIALVGQSMLTTTGVFGGAQNSSERTGLNDMNAVRDAIVGRGIPTTSAQRIDSKYDDGNPNTGNLTAANTGAHSQARPACALGVAGNNDYNTSNRGNDCVIYARFAP